MAASGRAEGPWGGAALTAVRTRIAKGWPPGLTVLTGDDLYHLDGAQAAILDHLVPDGSALFALSIVGDLSITTGALVGAARSSGMFASRRVVLLRDVAALEGDPEPLAAFAKAPPSEGFIVVRAPKLDRKRKLHKALAEAGTCVVFRSPANTAEFRALAAEMTSMATERGLSLEDRAAGFILEVCGNDLHRIAGELDKLAIWAGPQQGGKARIDAETVRALVAGSGLLSGWELADALTERDRREATASARRLIDAGDEPIRILGGLASRARSLLRAKAMTEAGRPAKDVVDASRAWYFKEALAKGLSRYSLPELMAMPAALLAVDRSFKSRSLDRGALLQALVAELTGPSTERR